MPLLRRHEFEAPVYVPDAEVNARLAVPVKLIVLSVWLSVKFKLLPMRVPVMDAIVPQEASLAGTVTWPAN